jgi:hypothetical protein
MARYYVDTNIWLDFLESRGSYLKPYGEFAFQFFKKCIQRKDTILYSDLVLDEISVKYNPVEVEKHCFSLFQGKNLLEHVTASGRQKEEARKLKETSTKIGATTG